MQNNNTLKSYEIITEYIKSGYTKEKRLGLELEHIIVHKESYKSLNYYEKFGQEYILLSLSKHFQKEKRENNRLIGLINDEYTLTLEPGGQLEISIIPTDKISWILEIYNKFLSLISPILNKHNLLMLNTGYSPKTSAYDIPLIPVKRYEFMDRYFKTSGTLGTHMMRGSASTQISVDFENESDLKEKLKAIMIISPVIKLLSSNTPFFESEYTDKYLIRTHIWNNVDNKRCKYNFSVFDNDFSINDYKEFIINTEAIYLNDENGGTYTNHETFAFLYNNKEITEEDVEHMLSMVFPDIRIKKYIELRMADSMDINSTLAYLSLIKGIVYSDKNRKYIINKYNISEKDIEKAEEEIMTSSFNSNIYNVKASDFTKEILDLAYESLIEEEKKYLHSFYEILEKKTRHISSFNDNIKLNCEYLDIYRNDTDKENSRYNSYQYLKMNSHNKNDIDTDISLLCHVYDNKDLLFFKETSEKIYTILQKIINKYIEDKNFQKLFNFSDIEKELINIDSSYKECLPFLRLDMLNDEKTKKIKFCEFNSNASSGMLNSKRSLYAINKSSTYKEFSKRHNILSFEEEIYTRWVDNFTSIYKSVSNKEKSHLGIIVCFDTKESNTFELHSFIEYFENKGFSVSIYDVRDIRYKDNTIYGIKSLEGKANIKIDCIWNFTIVSDIIKYYEESKEYIEGLKNNAAVLIGDYKSHIVTEKRLFSILRKDIIKDVLSDDEIKFINDFIPYTSLITDTKIENVIENKDSYIIKPTNMYSSENIFVGKDYTMKEWTNIIEKYKNDNFIVQEFVTPSTSVVVRVSDKESNYKIYKNLPSMYILSGEFCGIYLRQSNLNIIEPTRNGIVCPVAFIKEV